MYEQADAVVQTPEGPQRSANRVWSKGLAGEFSMDANGDGIKQTYPMVVRGGRWVRADW